MASCVKEADTSGETALKDIPGCERRGFGLDVVFVAGIRCYER